MQIPAIGRHNVYNALCAIAVGDAAGLTKAQIRHGLMRFEGCAMRAQIEKRGDITVIEDCYNASPESMRASLSVLAHTAKKEGRAIAFLGDMRELGADSAKMHFSVGEYAAECGVELLFTFGKGALDIAKGALSAGMSRENIISLEDTENVSYAAETLKSKIKKNDVILFKASRALKLERISSQI
jgi:UDP-N-acetylmuramyl pentapeptide synthase